MGWEYNVLLDCLLLLLQRWCHWPLKHNTVALGRLQISKNWLCTWQSLSSRIVHQYTDVIGLTSTWISLTYLTIHCWTAKFCKQPSLILSPYFHSNFCSFVPIFFLWTKVGMEIGTGWVVTTSTEVNILQLVLDKDSPVTMVTWSDTR